MHAFENPSPKVTSQFGSQIGPGIILEKRAVAPPEGLLHDASRYLLAMLRLWRRLVEAESMSPLWEGRSAVLSYTASQACRAPDSSTWHRMNLQETLCNIQASSRRHHSQRWGAG